jgi:menaquinol-cytochrome c reductase iron-sulfur subunit
MMERRAVLKLASGLIAAACSAIVGIPGVRYIVSTVRRRETSEETVQRVIRLKDLPVGRPVQVAISGRRRDAWTVYARESIGHVWLVRRKPKGKETEDADVLAFASNCPHLGCAVKFESPKQRFTCPCHKAAWNVSGEKLSDRQLGYKNPTPRALDSLECRLVDDEQTGEPWVEVKYLKFELGLTTKRQQS